MAMPGLGGATAGAEEGALSRPMDLLAFSSGPAETHRGVAAGQKTAMETRVQHSFEAELSPEVPLQTLGLRDMENLWKRHHPATYIVEIQSPRGLFPPAIQSVQYPQGDRCVRIGVEADFLWTLDVRVSQSRGRRSEPTYSTAYSSPPQGRLPGPIQFIMKLLGAWKLDLGDVAALLGFERPERAHVENLLNGRVGLVGRDVKDRIACLLYIRSALSALFACEEVENEWLREPHEMLGGQVPMHLLFEGSMDNLLLVKEYVDVVAGR